jgi:hypothetical protein
MAPQPPSTAGGSASLAAYHSAYNGHVMDRNGRFSHFILQPNTSHLQNGYWRFTSSQDERLAYQHGYHTPEDIMVAADSGEHHNEINLLWLPGTVDPNMKSQISGNARTHLRNIYDMRLILQKALSFRGRVPTYPVSPNLMEYWEVRRTAWSSSAEQYAAQASMGPTLMVPQTEGVSSPIVAAEHKKALSRGQRTNLSQGLSCSDPVITTAASSFVQSPAQSPGMTGTPPAFHHPTSPKSSPRHTRVSQHAEDTTIPSQLATRRPIPPHGTATASNRPRQSIAQTHNAVPHVQDGPRRHPDQVQDTRRPHVSQAARITAPNQQLQGHSPNLAVQPVRQGTKPPRVSLPTFLQHNTYAAGSGHPSTFSSSQSLSPYVSPYTTPSGPVTPPSLGPSGGHPLPPASLGGNTQNCSASRPGPGHGQEYNAFAKITRAVPQASSSNAAPKPQLKKQALSIDPSLAQRDQFLDATFSPPITPLSFDNDYGEPVAIGVEAPNHETVAGLRGEVVDGHAVVQHPQPANPKQTQEEEGQARSPKRSLEADTEQGQQAKRRKRGDYHDGTPEINPSVERSSPPTALDMYAELPCMDCGEMTGHKWDCHLGGHPLNNLTDAIDANEFTDIAPMKNLTVLDYRIFADSVEQLDPGPWTTHQGLAPEPEPEDPEAEIQGMAEIIRNEDTYMNDSNLHSLPDALMITLWALSTSPNSEVVYE